MKRSKSLTGKDVFASRYYCVLDGEYWKLKCKLRGTFLTNGNCELAYRTETQCQKAIERFPNL